MESNKQANASSTVEREEKEIYFAFLTKLLSLNAEFEAAKIGEGGGEFATSATEARNSAIQAAAARTKRSKGHPE